MVVRTVPRRTATVRLLGLGPLDSRELALLLHGEGIDTTADAEGAHDMVVVDLRGLAEAELPATVAQFDRRALACPVLHLVDSDHLSSETVTELARTDGIAVSEPRQQDLIIEIRRRVMQHDRTEEAQLRLAAMAAMEIGEINGVELPAPSTAILIGEPGPLAFSVLAELEERTGIHAVLGRSHALNMLETNAADAVFFVPSANRRPHAALVKLLRRHSELSAVPVIIVERAPTARHRRYWTRAGADAVVRPDQLQLAVTLADRRRQARRLDLGIDRLLREASFTESGEQSRLCAARFFETCLAVRCRTADAPFAIGAMNLVQKTGKPGASFTEPAVYVAVGTHPMDLVTRVAPDTLLIGFPATDRRSAEHAMRVLATLVGDLKFGLRGEPSTFEVKTNVVVGQRGDEPAALLRKAVEGIAPKRFARGKLLA